MGNNNSLITIELLEKVKQLFSVGKSEIQVAAELGMSKYKFKSLCESIEGIELKKIVELGRTLHEAFFEDLYQDAMLRKFDAKEGLIKAYMQNKFNWNEKTEVTEKKVSDNMTDEELDNEIKRLNPNAK